MNQYATKKTAAEGMLDIALFLANITHMKTVIEQGAGYRYYAAVLTLISFSLILQIVAGVLIVIIARRDLNVVSNQRRLDYLNNMTTGIVFATTVTNFFISFFGSKRTGFFRWLILHDLYLAGRRDLNNSTLQKRLDYLNNVTTTILFVTTGMGFFISIFGMQRTGLFPWLMIRIH
ncbi:hypothetical protein WMY93_030530 [Mugilogobius chulae]|uniref:Ninjurin 2 n=1 Tax=Mugilogobius chulae TaxID=88201 RepID=A0AAW0MPH5_9GOBI